MANILDIFRTHTGERLLQKAGEITSIKEEELRQAFIFSFPALLTLLHRISDLKKNEARELIEYIEEGDLISSGNDALETLMETHQLEVLRKCSAVMNITDEQLQKVLSISAGILTCIIAQIHKDQDNVKLTDVVGTLSGQQVKYDRDFVRTLIRNDDDPNFIDSSEKIALDHDNDNNDQSILGGYAGGR